MDNISLMQGLYGYKEKKINMQVLLNICALVLNLDFVILTNWEI